ncbi:MAG: Uma2 family endonuclease [Bacteroidota bacterium]
MPITQLSQLDLNRTYTYADYLTWQVKDRLELLRGKISLMSPAPNLNHQKIVGNLFIYIGQFLLKKPCHAFVAPFDVRLPRIDSSEGEAIYTVVQPDICVICDENKLDQQGCKGAPDLVVEVLSPGNTHKEMREKYGLYEEAGVHEYWLVDPTHLIVTRYIRNEEGIFIGKQPLTDQDTLDTPLLPGLTIDLKDVFG